MLKLIGQVFNLLFAYKSERVKGKKPWQSKLIWGNVFALVGVILSKYAGYQLTAEETAAGLLVVNTILRLITKGSVGFYEQ